MEKKRWNPLLVVLGLSGAFFTVFLILAITLVFWRPHNMGSSRSSKAALFDGSNQVGVVELKGVILNSKKILEQLEDFEEDDSIKAVVMRLESPGGSVAPSQEIYNAVKAFPKPLVVSMGSVAASGAYYIASGAKTVYANAGTLTGSIGVIMEFANLRKLYEWAKIERYAIKTGKFKSIGAEYKEMTAEERAILQALVDDVLKQFKDAVKLGRKLSDAEVTKVADGRIFSGAQAKDLRLVDEVGGIDEAIAGAAKLAGIKDKPNVVYPNKGRSRFMEFILDQRGEDEESKTPFGLMRALMRLVSKGEVSTESILGLEPGIYWIWPGYR